jgi:hypothetical protein
MIGALFEVSCELALRGRLACRVSTPLPVDEQRSVDDIVARKVPPVDEQQICGWARCGV